MNVGQVCIKLAGRDAGKLAVIIEKMDSKMVLIDGEVRRRKCNINHLEPTSKTIEIGSGASEADVKKAFEAMGWSYRADTNRKPAAEKPRSARATAVNAPPEEEAKRPRKSKPAEGKPPVESGGEAKAAGEKPVKAKKARKAAE